MATPAPVVRAGGSTPPIGTRGFDKLVLAPTTAHPGVDRSDPTARVVSDPATFRRILARSRPALVVIFDPPATDLDVEAVIHQRRRRTDMRAVLVDEPPAINDRLAALRSGFDQAVGADIDGRELAGRLALLADYARGLRSERPIVISEDVVLDPSARELRIKGERVHLRPRECALLEVLARHPGRTFSREQLLEAVGAGTSCATCAPSTSTSAGCAKSWAGMGGYIRSSPLCAASATASSRCWARPAAWTSR